MNKPYIMPLGFVDRITHEGTIFLLTNPEDSKELCPGSPVTVWRYLPQSQARAKLRGSITAVGYTTATFSTTEFEKDPTWPDGEPILIPDTPVFLALEDSYDPDPARKVTAEKAEAFQRYAERYAELTALPEQASKENLQRRRVD